MSRTEEFHFGDSVGIIPTYIVYERLKFLKINPNLNVIDLHLYLSLTIDSGAMAVFKITATIQVSVFHGGSMAVIFVVSGNGCYLLWLTTFSS